MNYQRINRSAKLKLWLLFLLLGILFSILFNRVHFYGITQIPFLLLSLLALLPAALFSTVILLILEQRIYSIRSYNNIAKKFLSLAVLTFFVLISLVYFLIFNYPEFTVKVDERIIHNDSSKHGDIVFIPSDSSIYIIKGVYYSGLIKNKLQSLSPLERNDENLVRAVGGSDNLNLVWPPASRLISMVLLLLVFNIFICSTVVVFIIHLDSNLIPNRSSIDIVNEEFVLLKDSAGFETKILFKDLHDVNRKLDSLMQFHLDSLMQIKELPSKFREILEKVASEKNVVRGGIANVENVNIGDKKIEYHFYFSGPFQK